MNFNLAPYYDDFDDSKNFHQILFRPGFPVQARELTQIQTILQDQVRKFGNHIFKDGTVVFGGNADFDSGVRCVRIELNQNISATSLIGKSIKGATTGVEARCVHATMEKLFVKFTSRSNLDPQVGEFSNSEIIEAYNSGTSTWSAVGSTIDSSSVTPATIATIAYGIFYWGGFFVTVNPQTIVVSDTSSSASAIVGLSVVESIVDDTDDDSLRDPAMGESNENAPGAHRYKLSMELSTFSSSSTLSERTIILFELKEGLIERLFNTTSYSEIMKMLARRTYEESGNYIARDYDFSISNKNDSELEFVAKRGLSFVGGYEVDNKINKTSTTIQKARSTATSNNALFKIDFGNFLLVGDNKQLPRTWSNIALRDDSITSIGTPAGNIVGFAKVRSVEKTSVFGVFKVFIFDVEFAPNQDMRNVASYSEVGVSNIASGNVLAQLGLSSRSGIFNTTNEISSQNALDRFVVAVGVSNDQLFCKRKAGAYSWVSVGDPIKQATTNSTATVATFSLLNDSNKSTNILSLPKSAIKTTSDFIYEVSRQVIVSTDASGNGSTNLGSGETIVDSSKAVGWVLGSTTFVSLSLSDGSSSVGIAAGPTNATIIVSVCVRKPNSTQKSKVETTSTISGIAISGKTKISLGVPDAFELISIVDGAGIDYASRYILRPNQKNGSLSGSFIELRGGSSSPASPVTITFKYFANGSGDFSTVNSYPNITTIPSFASSTGEKFVLQDCVDFRPKTTNNSRTIVATITSGNSTITLSGGSSNGLLSVGDPIFGPGVNATISSISANNTQAVLSSAPTVSGSNLIFVVGFNPATYKSIPEGTSEAISSTSDFVCDVEYYLPRRDTIVLTSQGTLDVIQGNPSETPISPNVDENEFRMKLCDLFIPAFTYSPKDVGISKHNRRRYTMQDIGKLDARLSNVEEITALTMLEQDLASTQIIDPLTGMNRFKSGFVVDNFSDHAVIDLSEDSIANIDYDKKELSCVAQEVPVRIAIVTDGTSSNYSLKDGKLMISYVEEVLISQPMASRTQNVNPFAAFKWIGDVKISPNAFFWKEEKRLADIVVSNNIVINQ